MKKTTLVWRVWCLRTAIGPRRCWLVCLFILQKLCTESTSCMPALRVLFCTGSTEESVEHVPYLRISTGGQ